MSYYLYILECDDKTLYTGITTELERRVDEHNHSTKGSKYTRIRRPVTILYHETYPDRSSASKREHEVKKMSRNAKLNLINRDCT